MKPKLDNIALIASIRRKIYRMRIVLERGLQRGNTGHWVRYRVLKQEKVEALAKRD